MSYSEPLTLPSRGIIYGLDSFDGIVNVKAFTTKSYKDLLTGNATEAAIKQFIDDCLVDCPIKAKNMNQNDIMAILFKTRSMTLGDNLKTQVKCPICGNIENVEWELSKLEIKYLYADEYPIKVVLPNSGKEIKVRFPTGSDTLKANQEAERRAKNFNCSPDNFKLLYALASVIDVDSKDLVEKAEWYESLNPNDAIYIDAVFAELAHVFGVNMEREICCSKCDYNFSTIIDISSDFFRPFRCNITGVSSKVGNLRGIS